MQEVHQDEQELAGPVQAKAAESLEPASNTALEAQKAANISEEVASLQKLLMAKEKEIGQLQKHIDKQDLKAMALGKENEQLQEQLKLSSEGD